MSLSIRISRRQRSSWSHGISLSPRACLQYANDPLQTLKDLFALEISYVYVTRTAVTNIDAPIYTKQETELAAHGPGVLPNAPNGSSSQPLTLVSYNALASAIPSNYELIFKFDESEDRTMSIGGRSVSVRDVGFLCVSLRSSAPRR